MKPRRPGASTEKPSYRWARWIASAFALLNVLVLTPCRAHGTSHPLAIVAPAFQVGEAALQPSQSAGVTEGRWAELLMDARFEHTAIYDPKRDRMLVFGGYDGSSLPNDTWELSLAASPTWTQLVTNGTPNPRTGHSAIYDPVRDRMLVFGGDGGYYLQDVWALSLTGTPTWTPLAPSGTPPSPRYEHSAIYDPVRDRMLVFGGTAFSEQNDVWALSLSGTPTWTQLTPSGTPPSPRFEHTAIYDPVRDRMVVFGGTSSSIVNEVWALSLAGTPTWVQLVPDGGPPSPRVGHTAIYDSTRDAIVVFAGYTASALNDVWALSLAGTPSWTQLVPGGALPSQRYEHTAIYDPVRDRMVVFGGTSSSLLNDVWALSLAETTWTEFTPGGPPPSPRYEHTTIYDSMRDRMVVFGGRDGSIMNDVWALSLETPTWTQLTPSGTSPSPRYGHTTIYDPMRDRMVVFGGSNGSFLNDVWALSLAGTATWTQLTPSGAPPSARQGHSAIYDPMRDRMVVFGGSDGSFLNDVWALSLAGTPTWTKLSPSGTPPSERESHTAIYDPVRDRMVVFGGSDGVLRNDVWEISLAGTPTWAQLTPSGTPPSGRNNHAAIYDPVRDRMLVFGGYGGSSLNDVWALSFAGTPSWAQLTPSGRPPPSRRFGTAFYDPGPDRMVIFGGSTGTSQLNDVWVLGCLGSTCEVDVPRILPEVERVSRAAPNPTRGRADVRLEVPTRTLVRAGIYDLAGRLLRRIAEGTLESGVRTLTWDGTSTATGRVIPGVYFWRITLGGREFMRTTVVIR